MTAPVIIDAIALAVLVGLVLWGARKGLLRTLTGLLVIVVSLVGANVIAEALTEPAAKLVAPIIEERIEVQMEEVIRERLPGQMPGSMPEKLEDILELLGLDEARRDALGARAEKTIRETGTSAATAVVESLARSFLHSLLYMVSFTALTALLHILVRALNLMSKLPVLRGLNALGGGLLGLIEALLLLFLAAWLMKTLGVFSETLAESHILSFFAAHSPLEALLFLSA